MGLRCRPQGLRFRPVGLRFRPQGLRSSVFVFGSSFSTHPKMSRKWCTYADCVRGYASDKDVWLRRYQIQNEEDAIEIASALSVQVITSKPRGLYILPYHCVLFLST